MRRGRCCFKLTAAASVLFAMALFPDASPAAGLSSVMLSPAGGKWQSIDQTNFVFAPASNRLITVVRTSTEMESYKVVRFDASTHGFAGGVPTAVTSDVRVIRTALSPQEDFLLIGWGDKDAVSLGTEREIPVGVEKFNLGTLDPSDSVFIPVPFHHFDSDPVHNRLIGIANPVAPATAYDVVSIDLSDDQIAFRTATGIATTSAIPKDAVFDPTGERLLVLWMPTKPGSPNTVQKKGFVASYAASSGILGTTSPSFPGAFTRHSLALSAAGRRLAAIARDSNEWKIPVLDADTLALHNISEDLISSAFESGGAGIFSDTTTLWIVNAEVSEVDKSIALLNTSTDSLLRFVSDATESTKLVLDPIGHKVFAASLPLQSMYVIPDVASKPSGQVDVAAAAVDLDVDESRGIFELLSDNGSLFLVSDDETSFYGRLSGFGAHPLAGLLTDPPRQRLLVGRQSYSPPRVLETLGYTTQGSLPVPADAMAIDVTRNLIYTAGLESGPGSDRVLREIDGAALSVIRQIALIPRIFLFDNPLNLSVSARPPTGLAVDPDERFLWVLSPPYLSKARLRTFDLISPATSEYVFPSTYAQVSDLIRDKERNRILVSYQRGFQVGVHTFVRSVTGAIQLTGDISFPGVEMVVSSAFDPIYDLAYYLTRTVYEWGLVVIDLGSDQLLLHSSLDFLFGSGQSGLAFNSITDRFAAFSDDGRLYLFDNPVSSLRRPGPVPPDAFLDAGSVGQTTAGIEIRWRLNPALPEGKGYVVVERRQLPDGRWIKLSPILVPPSIQFWTDTTAEYGAAYEYRVRVAGTGPAGSSALQLGPFTPLPVTQSWLADIPDIVRFFRPGEMQEVTLFLPRTGAPVSAVSTGVRADAPLGATMDAGSVPLPGAARVTITCPTSTEDGIYGVVVTATAGALAVHIPTLIHVAQQGDLEGLKRIPRNPPSLTLSSDSNLQERVLSVRGQLGLLRSLVKPEAIVVDAWLPNGATAERTVYATTGEFTADFQVPVGVSGEWRIRATLPGSIQTVGSQSDIFSIPVTPTGAKGDPPTAQPDFGEILLMAGPAATDGQQTLVDSYTTKALETFVNQRFSSADVHPLRGTANGGPGDNTLTPAAVESAFESISTRRHVLVYMVGHVVSKSGGYGFVLNATGDLLTPDALAAHLGSLEGAKPLVVIDSPHAGAFQQALSALPGAHLFSSNAGYGQWFQEFSALYMSGIKSNKGFGQAFTRPLWIGTAPQSLDPNLPYPQGTNWDESTEYYSLKLGSAFTPARGLLRDETPPRFLDISPPHNYATGESAPLTALVEDLPFDGTPEVWVEARHPDQWIEKIALHQNAEDPHRFDGSLDLVLPGKTELVFYASDDQRNTSAAATHATVLPPGSSVMDPGELLRILKEHKVGAPDRPGENPPSMILRASPYWYQAP